MASGDPSRKALGYPRPDVSEGAICDYKWNVLGIILDDGKVILLPKEPVVVAKVIELSVTEHFRRKAYGVPGLNVHDDLSGRGYPDVLLGGSPVGH